MRIKSYTNRVFLYIGYPISTSINIKQIISKLPVTLRIGIIALILFGICYVIASLDMSKKVNFKIKNATIGLIVAIILLISYLYLEFFI